MFTLPTVLLLAVAVVTQPPASQENQLPASTTVTAQEKREATGQQPAIDPLADYRAAALSKWDNHIRQLEKADASEQPDEKAVLFVGSSSIRLWNNMAEDLAPWKTIRRGYGGAKFSDVAVFIERLVQPHRFQAIVFFVGNDISGKADDKSPDEVVRLCRYIVDKVRQSHPQQEIFFIAVTPTISRFEVWPQIKAMNEAIAKFCDESPAVHFIPTEDTFLDGQGRPKAALFRDDELHLNKQGYAAWTQVIKRALRETLKSAGH